MHYHAEVWLPESKDYVKKIHYALYGLHEDNGGFYDWYVIGGRWSGEHTLWLLKKRFGARKINRINDEFDKKYGWWTNNKNPRELRQKQYAEIFGKHISAEEYCGMMPEWRDTYKDDGYSDDIIEVKKIPWKFFDCYTLLLEGGEYFQSSVWNGSTWQDTKFSAKKMLKKRNLYKGFLVTVDYHC